LIGFYKGIATKKFYLFLPNCMVIYLTLRDVAMASESVALTNM